MLVNDPNVFGLLSRPDEVRGHLGRDREEDLGHDDQLLSRKSQLLDRVSEDDFGVPIRVDLGRAVGSERDRHGCNQSARAYVRSVEGLDPVVVSV